MLTPPRHLILILGHPRRRWRLPIIWLWPAVPVIGVVMTCLIMLRCPRYALAIPDALAEMLCHSRGLRLSLGRYHLTLD